MTLRANLSLAILLLLAGCYWGPRLDAYSPAQGPEGIRTTLVTATKQEYLGELLALDDLGLVVLSNEAVLRIFYSQIRRATFNPERSLNFGAGRPPGGRTRERLRLRSRFPQGLDPAVLDRLLAAYGQDELEEVQ